MGTVFKKTYMKPLPAVAETFFCKGERLVRWKDRKGKTRTALMTVGKDSDERIIIESPFYVAKYRDGNGIVREVSTGCRDETAARGVLADLERRAELVKAKVITTAEDAMADHSATSLADHFAAFDSHLVAKGASQNYRSCTRRYLDKLAEECRLSTLSDITRERLERWLASRVERDSAAKTRNAYRGALVTFCNWCVNTDRLMVNPVAEVAKANEQTPDA